MPRRALNVVAASMPLLALSAAVAVGEGPLWYHVPYVKPLDAQAAADCYAEIQEMKPAR